MSAVLAFLGSCSSDSPSRASAPKATPVVNNSTQDALAPISALPPGSTDRPLLPGQEGTVYTPDGLPALLPSKGISADQLFAEKISDEDKRMDRIENAIIEMRREFDAVKPAIIRLTAVESDMQDLITQLQTVTGAAPPPQTVPEENVDVGDIVMPALPADAVEQKSVKAVRVEPPEPVTPVETAAPVIAAGGDGVTDIRSGMQGDASRIVLDIGSDVTYTRDLDNTEHVLMIELPKTAWNAASTGTFKKAALLKSWSVKTESAGSIVAIQLNGPAQITYEKLLPGKGGAGKRLVLDLKPE